MHFGKWLKLSIYIQYSISMYIQYSKSGQNVGQIFQEHVKTFDVYSIFIYAAFLMARGTTYPKVSNKTWKSL